MDSPPLNINLISCGPMAHVSDIKLIRTDTTLDLSQKAEKGMSRKGARCCFYICYLLSCFVNWPVWDSYAAAGKIKGSILAIKLTHENQNADGSTTHSSADWINFFRNTFVDSEEKS
ncbi:hypothetical protein RJT34_03459 [Clitoria ternatea]|uniref:Uncharacterized protein n=1 Tax=Clitoria ternatea TaxID=43366 RepID=A0AAN9Q1S2_CLITE